jgi:hypothetical protein
MKTPKPGSFGHRGLIGKEVVAKEANRVSAINARYLKMGSLPLVWDVGWHFGIGYRIERAVRIKN